MTANSMVWGMKVLVVEDDSINRMMVAKILRRFVAEVAEAEDGLHALGVVEGFRPDMVITDLSMPNLDGLALARELRARGLDAAVVALSAHNEDAILEQASRDGIRCLLNKPVKIAEVLAVIEALAAERGIAGRPRPQA